MWCGVEYRDNLEKMEVSEVNKEKAKTLEKKVKKERGGGFFEIVFLLKK